MKFDSSSLKKILQESDSKSLVLPNFQRAYVWNEEKQKTLISSFLLDLPTGSFLHLNGNSEDFAAREVCFPNVVTPKENCSYLLDGQQRFSTLKNAFTDLYSEKEPSKWREVWTPLFRMLRLRYFIRINVPNSDYFGYLTLRFDKNVFHQIEPSNLIDYIDAKSIMAKNEGSFFHPGFSPVDSDGKKLTDSKRRAEIINGMTEEEIVPLFELSSGKKTKLHSRVLSSIAARRQNKLRDEVGDDKEKIVDILSHVDEDIDEYLEDNNAEAINRAWITLSTNWAKDVEQFLESRMNNKMAQIILERDEIARAFAIFEVINQPGTPLDEYDLVVAKAARDTKLKNLTERILDVIGKNLELPNSLTAHVKGNKPTLVSFNELGVIDDKAPSKDVKTRFLQMLSILSHCLKGEEPLLINHLKREKFLSLQHPQINDNYDVAINSLLRAYAFFHIRCGIVNIAKIPFKLMIIPVAYALRIDSNWNSKEVIDAIEYWYWSSIFSGHYKMNQNSRGFEDILQLERFIEGDKSVFRSREQRVFNDEEYSDRKTLCMDPDSEADVPKAIDQGILQFILSNQPRDFLDGDNVVYLNSWDISNKVKIDFDGDGKKDELSVEDHHICPLAGKATMGESTSALRNNKKERLNSPLNRTYISRYSNRMIAAHSPVDYFRKVSNHAKFGHCIPLPIDEKYTQKEGESTDDYYSRVLKERFEVIKMELQKELISLCN